MEPEFNTAAQLLNIGLTYAVPFTAFMFGVYISDRLQLHDMSRRGNLYLMAVPVAMITIGLMISSSKVETASFTGHGFLSSIDQYLIFNGLIIFYGTLVPQTFADIRRRVASKGTGDTGEGGPA